MKGRLDLKSVVYRNIENNLARRIIKVNKWREGAGGGAGRCCAGPAGVAGGSIRGCLTL